MSVPGEENAVDEQPSLQAAPPRRKFMTVDNLISQILDEQIERHARGGWIGAPLSRCQMLRALLVRGALCTCTGSLQPVPVPDRPRRRRLVEVDKFVLDVLDEQIAKHESRGIRTRMRRGQMMRRLVLRAARCTCPVE